MFGVGTSQQRSDASPQPPGGGGRVLGDRVGWKPSQLCRGPGGVPSHLLCKREGFIARIHTDSCSGNGLVGDQDLEGANLGYQRQEGLGKGHGDKHMGVAVALP